MELRKKELREMNPIFEELEQVSRKLSGVTEASQESRSLAFERQSLVSQLFRLTAAAKIPALVEYVTNLIESKAPKTVLFGEFYVHHHSFFLSHCSLHYLTTVRSTQATIC